MAQRRVRMVKVCVQYVPLDPSYQTFQVCFSITSQAKIQGILAAADALAMSKMSRGGRVSGFSVGDLRTDYIATLLGVFGTN